MRVDLVFRVGRKHMRRVVAGVEDLLFRSKISSTADSLGVEATFARNKAKLLQVVAESPPDLLILDLASERHEPLVLLEELKSAEATKGIPVVGYAPHVRGDLILAARERGCDRIVARSAFVNDLSGIIGGKVGV